MSATALRRVAAVFLLTAAVAPAHAALDLGTYQVSLQRGIDFDEASGITYNYDKNILFMVDDEGDDLAEFSLGGDKLTVDKIFNRDQLNGGYRDIEGVTYYGNGQYALAEERTEEIVRIVKTADNAPVNGLPSSTYTQKPDAQRYLINGGTGVGNNGLEGVAYDPTTDSFFGVRQGGTSSVSQQVYQSSVNFDPAAAGGIVTGTTTLPFDPAVLGLATLSDVATLSSVPDFTSLEFGQNLLILSLGSNLLVEVSRTGQLLSSFDLSGLDIRDIEGVALDFAGNIYLVGEQGGVTPGDGSTSGLVVLSRVVAPVPEPATWAMMIGGFGLIGGAMRRRATTLATA